MEVIDLNVLNNQKVVYKKISTEVRQLIINQMDSGKLGKEVADFLKLSPNTVRDIYKRYQKKGIIEKQVKGHRKQVLSNERKELICDWVDIDCTITLKKLKTKCLLLFNSNLYFHF